ncbi:MAG: hypothetical protein QM790_02050 [Nibricoccus sp.]
MKKSLIAGVVLLGVLLVKTSAAPLIDEPVDVTLKNGNVLHAAQAKSFSASVVMVKSAEGIQTVAYDQFPDEYRPALDAKRPAKRSDAQIEADRAKAQKNQPLVPPLKKRAQAGQDLYYGMRIDSYRPNNGNTVEVTITNTSETQQEIRPWRLLAYLSSEEIIKGADFVTVDSSGNVTTILRSHQFIPANSTVSYMVIFGRAMKGGTVQKVDWYR